MGQIFLWEGEKVTTLNNRQIDLGAVAKDLGLKASFETDRAITIAHGLVERIKYSADPTAYLVPNKQGYYRVILPSSGFPSCSCSDWMRKHKDLFGFHRPRASWICAHGAAVLLSLGRSDTYLDFLSLPQLPTVPSVEMDNGLDRRRFFAAFSKKYLYRWGTLGIDLEMAHEAMRREHGVDSLSKLKQRDWAMLAARFQAATKSRLIMKVRAAEIKAILSREK